MSEALSEFALDHVPGAINLPVLSDEERAEVGTIYVQESPFRARKIGAAKVARSAARHIETALSDKDGGWRPLIYCWRGGQRSGSFASILSQIGWRSEVLEGGYQSYRRLVVNRLYEEAVLPPLIVLDGNTGTAKSEVLRRLPALGVQMLDLEGLANHRGSALGGQGDQPSQKAFETALALRLVGFEHNRPVVVEAESSRVGALNLPPALFAAMKAAPRIEIRASVADRAAFLTRAYADLTSDCDVLVARLDLLRRIQGGARVVEWQEMARGGAFEALAGALITHHYDPRYAKTREKRGTPEHVFEAKGLDEAAVGDLAREIAEWVSRR